MAVTIKINPCPERYNSANPYKTGQTTSYATNDDGDLERGRGSSWTDLGYNNPFGNTNRFTDTTGAQTYSNNWVIDWSGADYVNEIVIGYYQVLQTISSSWTLSMQAQPITIGSFNDCYVVNAAETNNIISFEDGTNYAPFNNTSQFITSTTQPFDSNYTMLYNSGTGFLGRVLKSSVSGVTEYMLTRTFTFTELGV